jgi:predicted DNA-binding ribbon-helix-helix protein
MVRTQIQLTENQARILKKMAEQRRVSMAELIRRSVDQMIRFPVSGNPEEKKKKAIEAAGQFSSGRRNISRRHDGYLSEDLTQ